MPYFNISRDKFPQDMYMMKNKLDKIIICYSLDERSSIPHCQLLFQKGFDNIYMLTGGIEEFIQKFPTLCEGKGMSRILLEQQKKKEQEEENNVKTKYSKSSKSKAVTIVGKPENSNNDISSKTSMVSGVSSVSKKTSISTLKKNLGV